jgi:hypothetical protein
MSAIPRKSLGGHHVLIRIGQIALLSLAVTLGYLALRAISTAFV